MTSRIIYHDFQNPSELSFASSAVMLTAPILAKGRRLLKTTAAINAALNALCLVLCGTCISFSIFIFVALS